MDEINYTMGDAKQTGLMCSPNDKHISEAFVNAQKAMVGAKKSANNPFFKSKYADLGSVIEACRMALLENDIGTLQPEIEPIAVNGVTHIGVETVLKHKSGEWIKGNCYLPVKNGYNAQDKGSALTYARRYGLQGLICLPTEDDDGNLASQKAKVNAPPVAKKDPNMASPVEKVAWIKDLQEIGVWEFLSTEEIEGLKSVTNQKKMMADLKLQGVKRKVAFMESGGNEALDLLEKEEKEKKSKTKGDKKDVKK